MFKSTEIVIEQLIIGLFFFLILAIFLFGGELLSKTTNETVFAKFAFGVLIIIGAYGSGIVIDRWSDTLLDRLYNINRVQTITKRIKFSELHDGGHDPFPEACLRMEIWQKDDGISDQHDYLRTRMRITRAITCLLPAFFLSIQSAHAGACVQQRRLIGIVTLGLYAGLTLIAIRWGAKNQPPKTYNVKALKDYVVQRDPDCSKKDKLRLEMKKSDFIDQSIFGLVMFTIFSAVLAIHFYGERPGEIWHFFYPAVLFLMTFLVGQTWWRISQTFFNLLYNFKYFKFSKRCDNEEV